MFPWRSLTNTTLIAAVHLLFVHAWLCKVSTIMEIPLSRKVFLSF